MAEVTIECSDDATLAYVWGDKTLAFYTCRTCGCTTHWLSLRPDEISRMAVNCRMAAPEETAEIRARHFDGAETWTYLD
jgi:hypothetical protein